MADSCQYCSTEIAEAGLIRAANRRINQRAVELINFVHKTDYAELCEKCGTDLWEETFGNIKQELREKAALYEQQIIDFPMMTIGFLPEHVEFKVKGLVTANVTVGTGFFNEFSQGISDIFGVVNSTSGMALKVNSGEAVARAILVQKAIAHGANAVIGVDIDYGTTTNNAATINMQGTAVTLTALEMLLDSESAQKARALSATVARTSELQGLLKGDFGADSKCEP